MAHFYISLDVIIIINFLFYKQIAESVFYSFYSWK